MSAAVLAFDAETAALLVESLTTALLGGSWPTGGRRALFALKDALDVPCPDRLVGVELRELGRCELPEADAE